MGKKLKGGMFRSAAQPCGVEELSEAMVVPVQGVDGV
jgi:hypothetical protein